MVVTWWCYERGFFYMLGFEQKNRKQYKCIVCGLCRVHTCLQPFTRVHTCCVVVSIF